MTGAPDGVRVAWLREALERAGLDALIASTPSNVLMVSGYWPVLGASVAVATRDGRVAVAVPDGEEPLVARGWSAAAVSFPMGSLDALRPVDDAAAAALRRLGAALGLGSGRTGFESGPQVEPSSYAAMHVHGAGLPAFLSAALPDVELVPGASLFTELRTRKTPEELARIRRACRVAEAAFLQGSAGIRPGMTEIDAAGLILPLLGRGDPEPPPAHSAPGDRQRRSPRPAGRAGGFAWCMAGPNASRAYLAFARSTDRRLAPGELALVHCNSYADGYWTDITRTYVLGTPGPRQREMYEAVFAARDAALAAIRPGVRAAEVDAAARRTLAARGFDGCFKHGTGHEVGFGAIAHTAPPRLHPASPDVLAPGMVFNMEPAIYIGDEVGLRHCDIVEVTDTGAQVLTPFQAAAADLVLPA